MPFFSGGMICFPEFNREQTSGTLYLFLSVHVKMNVLKVCIQYIEKMFRLTMNYFLYSVLNK